MKYNFLNYETKKENKSIKTKYKCTKVKCKTTLART